MTKCCCCGCELSQYEEFAGRLRGLKKPVCMGCAFEAVTFLRVHVMPMLDKALDALVKARQFKAVEVER